MGKRWGYLLEFYLDNNWVYLSKLLKNFYCNTITLSLIFCSFFQGKNQIWLTIFSLFALKNYIHFLLFLVLVEHVQYKDMNYSSGLFSDWFQMECLNQVKQICTRLLHKSMFCFIILMAGDFYLKISFKIYENIKRKLFLFNFLR